MKNMLHCGVYIANGAAIKTRVVFLFTLLFCTLSVYFLCLEYCLCMRYVNNPDEMDVSLHEP